MIEIDPAIRAAKVDMSPSAIERRLKEFNEVWKLCVTLANARRTSTSNKQASRMSDRN